MATERSAVEVTLGRKAVQVRNTVGWPGQTNVYRVDFRVPDAVKPGLASVGLIARRLTP